MTFKLWISGLFVSILGVPKLMFLVPESASWESVFWISVFGQRAIILYKQHIVPWIWIAIPCNVLVRCCSFLTKHGERGSALLVTIIGPRVHRARLWRQAFRNWAFDILVLKVQHLNENNDLFSLITWLCCIYNSVDGCFCCRALLGSVCLILIVHSSICIISDSPRFIFLFSEEYFKWFQHQKWRHSNHHLPDWSLAP